MSIRARIQRLERLVPNEIISKEELKIREGYFSDWNEADLKAVVNWSVGEPLPEHIEKKLRKDGLIK